MDTTGTITLNFNLLQNDVAYSLLDVVTHSVINKRYKITDIKFYVNYINVMDTSGTSYQVSDYNLIDFDAGDTSLDIEVPLGKYTSINFALGIDSITNYGNPNGYAVDHPLGLGSDMHWNTSLGYLFVMVEGLSDTSSTGVGTVTNIMKYDIGTEALYRNVYRPINIAIADVNTHESIDFYIDIDDFFYNATDTIDFAIENLTHSTGSGFGLAERFMNNFYRAIQ